MAERLIPVRSESEIRIGAIYVLKNCCNCGAPLERFMVLEYLGLRIFEDDVGRAWAVAPLCRNPETLPYTGLDAAIEDGRLFRVEDNLDLNESNPYLVSKPKERMSNGKL